MAGFYFPFRWALPFGLLCILQLPVISLAQQPDVNGTPYETEEQTTGCPLLPDFPPAPSAKVVSCQKSQSVEVSMPLPPDVKGNAREKKVRGAYEFREYRVMKLQDSTFDNLLNALPMSSFIVEYASRPATITARNGDTWILINVSDDLYNVSVVHETQISCATTKDVEQISSQMQAHNRVAIYGLQFSPENHLILQNSSEILAALLKYLKQNPDLPVFIESHTFTNGGTDLGDFEITLERATAVVNWLVSNGIPATRLQVKPFGRTKPRAGSNGSPDVPCSERIEIAKAAK